MPQTSLAAICLLAILSFPLVSSSSHHTNTSVRNPSSVLADWRFNEYGTPITVMIFLVCVILLRMAYQRMHTFTAWIPESLVQIAAGILFGAALQGLNKHQIELWHLDPDLFFHFLLPPIVLEAAFSMYDRAILDYMGAIMLFAVLGSLLNFLLIAMPMWGLYLAGAFGQPHLDLDAKGFLLFSSFIIAVDPVAVLAIFQDIGVDLGLYYMVFGESLFNDAVTVVLYQVMSSFSGLPEITTQHIMIALFSFFTISLGGSLIGVVAGVLTCLITRYQSPMGAATVLILAYFSYTLSDCMGWSGIMALVCCGLIQTGYAFHNLSRVSLAVVRKVTKIAAELTESIIFLFMGLEVVSRNFEWHTGFCMWALVLCLVARSLVTVTLAMIINCGNLDLPKITKTEQVILIYGGLRGAVCFCLAVLVQPYYFVANGEYKEKLFITAAVFIIFFTNFVMGMTIKPLVLWLRIPMRQDKTLSLFNELIEHIIDELLVVMETIAGKKGRNALRDFITDIDEKYIRKVLQRDPETQDQKIVKLYEKIALKLHYATVQPAHSEMYLNRLAPNLRQQFTVERKPSVGSISGLVLPDALIQAEHKPNKLEEKKFTDSISSISMIDASISEEQEPSSKDCTPLCCKKRRPDTNIPELPAERRSSTFTSPRQSWRFGSFGTDDRIRMREYLRSSRHMSLTGKPKESEFANNYVQLLRSKSQLASRLQQGHRSFTAHTVDAPNAIESTSQAVRSLGLTNEVAHKFKKRDANATISIRSDDRSVKSNTDKTT